MCWQSFIVVCVGLLGGSACATGGRVHGERWTPPVDLSADDAVVYLLTDDSSAECTGTLVSERTVLTAAHCVDSPGRQYVRVGNVQISVADCALHPNAYAEPRRCGDGPGSTVVAHDLAVLTLARPAEVAPIRLLLTAPGLDPNWWSERAVRLVGWDRRPRLVGPLERRSGMNRIMHLDARGFIAEPLSRVGFATIIGDSGGPALVRIDGTEHVAGILSGGTAPGSRNSVYAATFEPDNARWLLNVLPDEVACDLSVGDEAAPFGEPETAASEVER